MLWDETFKRKLAGTSTKGNTDLSHPAPRVYAPLFRLQIGSAIVIGKGRMGSMERDAGPKILELVTHPNTCSQGSGGGWNKPAARGDVDGTSFLYGVALTGKITTGAQSVNARTFQYSGATLSVGVTSWGAAAAAQCTIGTLCKLQMAFQPPSAPDMAVTIPPQFYTIFIGVYKGMKWNGQQYTLNFGDGLEAARYHYTQDKVWVETHLDDDRGKWFAGCGSTVKVAGTVTDYSDSTVVTDLFFGPGSAPYRFGYTNKLKECWGGNVWGKFAFGGTNMPKWVIYKNSENKDSWLCYKGIGVEAGGTDLELRNFFSTTAWDFPLPGRDGHSLQEWAAVPGGGGLGDGTTITNCCVLVGTPVET